MLKRIACCVTSVSLLLSGIASCATAPPPSKSSISEEQRRQLGKVGIVSLKRLPKSEYSIPVPTGGQDVVKGIAGGALVGAIQGAQFALSTGGIGIVFFPFFVGAGAVFGGSYEALGSLNDIPEATARNLKAAISKALTSSQPQRSLRRNLINFARQEGLGELTDVSSSATQDDYRSLSEAGINSVVEVAVFEVWLAGKKRGDPKLVFGVRAYVRVVRTQDNSEVTSKFTLTYSGHSAP